MSDWIRVATTRAWWAWSVISPSDAMSSMTPATVVARTTYTVAATRSCSLLASSVVGARLAGTSTISGVARRTALASISPPPVSMSGRLTAAAG